MSLVKTFAFGWLLVSVGTFLFLSLLVLRALRNGGLRAYRKLDLSFPSLLLILLTVSLCWPWAWRMLRNLIGNRT